MDISNRLGMIKHCKKAIDESEDLDAQLAKVDLIVEQAEALLEYEKRGIPTIRPSPSKLIQAYREGRDALILKCAERKVEKAVAATEVLTDTDTKISWLKRIPSEMQQYRARADNRETLDALEGKVMHLIHQTQLGAYLENARNAELKGHRKRALELYRAALQFLKNDEMDKAFRQGNMPAIEAKIAELSKTGEAEPDENGA
jgi:hypothetical protein